MSVVNKFIQAITEYGFILNRDFNELKNILPHKREVFINSGVKIFLKKIVEAMQLFNIDIQHYIDTQPTEAMLGIVISMNMSISHISEFIVFDPIRGNVFFTDRDKVFFNDRIIYAPMKNSNKLILSSTSSLFLHNLYLCHMLQGCFKEIKIDSPHIERNKYALEILRKIPQINIQKQDNSIIVSCIN